MKALVSRDPGQVALETSPDPVPKPGEVLIRPVAVGVCGTDLEIIDGHIDPAYVHRPVVLGHEWSGVVVQGADLPGSPAVGARVVVEGIVPCRHCPACVVGDTNLCRTYDEFGFTRDGAAAELLSAPAELVHELAPQVSPESGALVEPASVVLRALLRASPQPGLDVLVVGDGTVALLAATLVRLWSPASVTMLGARPDQRTLAIAAGVDTFTIAGPSQVSSTFDLVVEAAGAAPAVSAAIQLARRGGQVVLLGLAGSDITTPLPIDDVVNGDLTISGSFSYTSSAFRSVVQLLNTGRLTLDFLVTHRFPLEQWEAALTALRHPTGTRGKIILNLTPSISIT